MGLFDFLMTTPEQKEARRQGEMVQEAYQKSIWDQIAAPKYPGPGSQAGLFGMDPMGNSAYGGPQPTIPVPRQGLMNPMQQEQFAVDVMSQPLYRTQGTQMLNDNWNRDWQQNNMTAYQKAMVDTQRTQNSIANMNASYDDLLATRKAYTSEVAPYTDALRSYDVVTGVLEQKDLKEFDGPEDYGLIVAFSKMAKPGEQLTEGEFDELGNSLGIPGLFAKFIGAASGKGTLGVPERTKLYNAMRSRVPGLEAGVKEINTTYDQITGNRPGIRSRYRLDPEMRESGQLPVPKLDLLPGGDAPPKKYSTPSPRREATEADLYGQ